MDHRNESQPRGTAERLACLAANARAGQWSATGDIDWRREPRLPFWVTREQVRHAISQLHHGEMATARMCRRLLSELEAGGARDCVALQAADEARHAEVYGRYLDRLGGVAPMDGNLASALEGAAEGPAGSLGAMVAFNVVVEGEVLRLQDTIAEFLPCPLLKQINRLIARDEARHVAFGRIYLTEALAQLSPDSRARLYHWVRALWQEASESTLARRSRNPAVRKVLRTWLVKGWSHHEAALARIGLTPGPAAERPE